MGPIIVGTILLVVGLLGIAAEARACEFERSNLPPTLAVLGVLCAAAGGFDLLFYTSP